MHFGATIREILTASCGHDLRTASAAAVVPFDSPDAMRTLGVSLELAFDITIPEHDLGHLRTVRDVMQCVRLRLWEKRIRLAPPAPAPVAAREARPDFVRGSSDPYQRFTRYTPPAPFAGPTVGTTRPKRV